MSFHLAGVIPVSSIKLDYNLPYHPCLLPIEEDFLLLHRSIMECAWAGCDTIWIVMDPDITPVFKKVVGDYVYDPLTYYRPMDKDTTAARTAIPIYFTTVDVRNRGKRDSYGWSIIEGAYMAYRVSNQLSKWIIPDMYYVSFPWSIYPPEIVREYRGKISSKTRFMITSKNEGVKQNKYLGFTFNQQDFIDSGVSLDGTKLILDPTITYYDLFNFIDQIPIQVELTTLPFFRISNFFWLGYPCLLFANRPDLISSNNLDPLDSYLTGAYIINSIKHKISNDRCESIFTLTKYSEGVKAKTANVNG